MKIKNINSNIYFRANKIPKLQAEYINNRLLSSKSTDIFCHIATDEDSFNSAKIMYDYLSSNGVKPRILCNNSKENYGFDEKKYDIVDLAKSPVPKNRAETAICIDFSEPVRIRGRALKYLHTFPQADVFCIDHHNCDKPIIESNIIHKSFEQEPKIITPKNGYMDTTARSAASILVRFFEALNIPMSSQQIDSAYCAMVDDMNKANLLSINNGQIVKSAALIKDKNADDVFKMVSGNISEDKKREILSHLDVLSHLSGQEQAFRENLFKKIMISDNKKFAYAIIEPNNKDWQKIGGDNSITSKILRDFRLRVLSHKNADKYINAEQIKKLQEVEAAAVFYPDYKTGRYRISIHSNKDFAMKIIDYNRAHYNMDLTAGGHEDRAGGSVQSLDEDVCSKWINAFILSAQNIDY